MKISTWARKNFWRYRKIVSWRKRFLHDEKVLQNRSWSRSLHCLWKVKETRLFVRCFLQIHCTEQNSGALCKGRISLLKMIWCTATDQLMDWHFLATRAGKMSFSCALGTTRWVPQERLHNLTWPQNSLKLNVNIDIKAQGKDQFCPYVVMFLLLCCHVNLC